MYSYNDIPVTIGTEIHKFNYEYLEESLIAKECTITSEGKTLVIDQDFAVVTNNMPGNWVDPAINKLKALLSEQQTPLP